MLNEKDIAKMSIEEASKLLEAVQKHQESLIEAGKKVAVDEVNKKIQEYKLTSKDLIFYGEKPDNIKYRKSDTEVWSGGGRGKKPAWVIAEYNLVVGKMQNKATDDEKNAAFIEHMKQYLVNQE